MRDALRIFRKDVRHHWPRVLLVLFLAALQQLLSGAVLTGAPIGTLLFMLWGLACIYLVSSVVHEDRLPGHEQYWLTRPYGRGDLLLAKLLFVGAFVVAPVLVAQAASLAGGGVSPWRYLPALFFSGVLFPGIIGASVAALAAVTENLVQLLWFAIPIPAAALLGRNLADRFFEDPQNWHLGGADWIRMSAEGALLAAMAAAVLAMQYYRRQTVPSRAILGCAFLAIALGPFWITWPVAMAVERWTSRGADRAVLITPDLARPIPHAIERDRGIAIPVSVSGMPPDTALLNERVRVRVECPDGRAWNSPWIRAGGLLNADPFEDSEVVTGNGTAWLYVNPGPSMAPAVSTGTVHVHARIALTLLGNRALVPIPAQSSGRLAGDAFCDLRPGPFQNIFAGCEWPARSPARAYIRAHSLRTGIASKSRLDPGGSYGPFPTDGSVWQRAVTSFSILPAPVEAHLETWQATGHFECDVDIPAIRLAAYTVKTP